MIYPVPKTKRAKRKKSPTPKEKEVIRRYVFARDEYKCQHVIPNLGKCLKPVVWDRDFPNSGHAAHIIAKSLGGPFTADNLILKCPDCHIRREHTMGEKSRLT